MSPTRGVLNGEGSDGSRRRLMCDVTMFWSRTGGGVRKYIERKLQWLGREMPGVRHLLVVPGPRSDAGIEEEEGGGRVTARVAGLHLPFAPGYWLPPSRRGTLGVLRHFRPDVIECASPFVMRRAVSAYLRWCERAGEAAPPVFDYYHAFFPRNYAAALDGPLRLLRPSLLRAGWRYLRRAYRDTSSVLLGSPAIARVLASRGIDSTRIAPLGVDLDYFGPAVGSEPRSDGPPSVLFVGRLSEEKSLSTVLETHAILRSRTGATLRIAGDGLLRGRVESLASSDPDVHYLGFLDRDGLRSEYRGADLLLSAATAETLGFCFLEALACGTPVVGIRGSGLVGLLPEDVCAAVPAPLPGPLSDACERMLEHGPSRERCREAVSGYGWDERLRSIVQLELEEAGLL